MPRRPVERRVMKALPRRQKLRRGPTYPNDCWRTPMKLQAFLTAIAISTLLAGATTAARAETMDDMRFGDLMTTKMMDKDKDGMVSRAEFLDMMGKMWDAKAKKMGAKNNRMTIAEFDEVLKYMRAGA
jgi:Ca2+-binding EF-hand superfamily protein